MSPMRGSSPFARPQISPGDQREYEDIADQMLDRTLRSYDQFQDDQQQPDTKRWKKIRSESSAAIYVKRESSGEDSLSGAHLAWRGLKDPMVIVGLGHCDGSADDMLLAYAGGDTRQSLASAAYLDRKIAGHAVVAMLTPPTLEDPFRLLSIEWIAYPAPPVLDLIVKTRDYVYLLAKGVTRRSNGDLIGYHLMQSVDLPECKPLNKERSYVRGRLMLGSIFIQRPNNSVDVFFETFVENNGHLANKVAQFYSTTALARFFHLDETAKGVKLHWCINMARRNRTQRAHNVRQVSGGGFGLWDWVNPCLYCKGIPAGPSGLDARCALCYLPVCSSCQRDTIIKRVSDDYDVVDERVVACATCLARAEGISALDVSRELVAWNDLHGSDSEHWSEASSSGRTPST